MFGRARHLREELSTSKYVRIQYWPVRLFRCLPILQLVAGYLQRIVGNEIDRRENAIVSSPEVRVGS